MKKTSEQKMILNKKPAIPNILFSARGGDRKP